MANTDKNIVITPNIGSSTEDPKIVFSAANSSVTASNITVRAYPTNSGMLSFEGSAGQLFSVTNSLTGTIFSVNDISGIPSIEVLDTGVLRLAQFSGNVGIGTASPAYKLDVSGPINTNSNVSISGNINLTTAGVVGGGGNILINGVAGTLGQVLAQTGAGVAWQTISSTSIFSSTSNVSVLGSGVDVVTAVGGVIIQRATSTGINVTGILNTSGNILGATGTFGALTLNGTTQSSGFINTSGNVSAAVHTGGAVTVTGFINTSANVSAATGVFGSIAATGFINTSGNVSAAVHSGGAVTVTGFINTTANVSGAQGMIGSLGVGTTASGTVGEIRATNNITAYYSDGRLKENITPIINALDKVNAIRGVTYNANDVAATFGYTDKKEQVGVIAQEIEAVLPQIVVPAPFDIAKAEDGSEYSKSGENYKTVYYDKLVPLLIEAIKELSARVAKLEGK